MTTGGLILVRRTQITIFFLLFFTAATLKVLLFPTYEAETVIMVDVKQSPTSIESDKIDAAQMVGLVRIHGDLIQSIPILKSVVDKLKLYDDIISDNKDQISDAERERLSRQAIELLRKKYLTVTSPAFTNLIQVKAKYKDPEKAARIANTIVEDYIKWSVDFLHRETRSVISYLEKELADAKQKLQESEENLEKFRKDNKIISLPEEVKAQLQLVPEEIKNHFKLVQALELKLLELEVELSRIRELYTDESPQVIYMKERIAKIQEELDNQRRESKTSEGYILKLMGIPEKEMMFGRLERQVKINEEMYLLLRREYEKARLADVKETTENIKIVSPALTPLKPKGRIIGLLIGAVVSFLLSLALSFILELRKLSKRWS